MKTDNADFPYFAHKRRLVEKLGYRLSEDCYVLDFGCGAGESVGKILRAGYPNAFGYDVVDYLGKSVDRSRFRIDSSGTIPFANDMFDFVLSDQVFEHVVDQNRAFAEIFRVLKPGGHAVHIIPAKYQLIEPHIYIPLGGLICSRWYYKFWALMGIRNEYQKNMTADEVADANTNYSVVGLRYIGSSAYRVLWRKIGYSFKFVEQEFLETSDRQQNKFIAKITRLVPPFWWLFRTFRARIVYMQKPNTESNMML